MNLSILRSIDASQACYVQIYFQFNFRQFSFASIFVFFFCTKRDPFENILNNTYVEFVIIMRVATLTLYTTQICVTHCDQEKRICSLTLNVNFKMFRLDLLAPVITFLRQK